MPLQPGEFVDRYRILEKLGKGGFGEVYRARDTRLERDVALKLNLDETDQGRRQFEKSARYLAGLLHSNLPQVLDFFSLPNGDQYLVMEFIDGTDLAELCSSVHGLPSLAQALAWMDEILDAVNYLHTRPQPVIHRDIKPANIRIDSTGHPYLVDFGIAKTYDPVKRTTMGAKAYTPGYSAPEQYGNEPTDAQSDLYSLGATFYTLLTGQAPPDSIDLLLSKTSPTPVHRLNPSVPEAVSREIETAMQVEKSRRHRTAAEFRAGLKAAAHAPPQPEQYSAVGSTTPKAAEWAPTMRVSTDSIRLPLLPVLLFALAGMLVVIMIVIVLVFRRTADDKPVVAALPSVMVPPPDSPTPQPLAALHTPQIEAASPTPLWTPTLPPPVRTQPMVIDDPTKPPTLSPTPLTPPGTIAFHSDRGGNLDVYIIRADGTGLRRMTDYSGKDSFPAWSPDGGMLAYQSIRDGNSEIFLLDVGSGESYRFTDNRCSDWAPSFSPDGKELAYYSECDGNREIVVTPLDGGPTRQLTHTTDKYNWYPFWSADGEWIYYSTNESGKYWVNRMDPRGDHRTPLVSGCSGVPSPLGGRLVYQDTCDTPWQLFIASDDGTNTELLVGGEDVIYGDPYWSPDERWVAFSSNLNGDKDIYLIDVLTKALIQLTGGQGNDSAPNWTAKSW